MRNEIKNRLLERFLKYARTCSESSGEKADAGIMPSTECQWDMAKILLDELQALGLENCVTTKNCYTYGFLPATKGMESEEPFCLLSHIDTADEVSGMNVKPNVIEKYSGEKICLDCGIVLDPSEDKELAECARAGDTIITTDGNTLLGADDKAGCAEIVTAIEYLVNHPEIPHGPIEVIFSPDEETGHGMDKVPLELMKSKFAYTVDGGNLGELETECFNAWKSEIEFEGVSVHTGSARGKMVNANLMAAKFISLLPSTALPETTDGFEGFFAVMETEASIEKARVSILLRDFTREGIELRKRAVDSFASAVEISCGGKVTVTHTQQYLNMKENLDKNPKVVQRLVNAYRSAGVEPVSVPIRGGTDGSRLTEMGIPCPNIFTGGHNFHSRSEWASLEQMMAATEILFHLAVNK